MALRPAPQGELDYGAEEFNWMGEELDYGVGEIHYCPGKENYEAK
jgi:hypothetical protein